MISVSSFQRSCRLVAPSFFMFIFCLAFPCTDRQNEIRDKCYNKRCNGYMCSKRMKANNCTQVELNSGDGTIEKIGDIVSYVMVQFLDDFIEKEKGVGQWEEKMDCGIMRKILQLCLDMLEIPIEFL